MSIISERTNRLVPPLGPTLVRSLAPVVIAALGALALHAAVGAWMPAQERLVVLTGVFVMAAVSLNIVNGFTGQFSMGHAAFMAVGAYVAGPFTYSVSTLLWATPEAQAGLAAPGVWVMLAGCLLGALVASALGYIVGLPSLRLRGDYLAIVTLGFGEIVRVLITQTGKQITWPPAHAVYSLVKDAAPESVRRTLLDMAAIKSQLPEGADAAAALLPRATEAATDPAAAGRLVEQFLGDDVQTVVRLWESPAAALAKLPLGGAAGYNGVPAYASVFWVFVCVGLTVLVAFRLKQSSSGRAFLSIREDEIAARAMGVNLTVYKVRAFVLAAFLAGLAGGLLAHSGTPLNPADAGFAKSFEIIIMVVLGGLGSISGVVIAAVGLTLLSEFLKSKDPPTFAWLFTGAAWSGAWGTALAAVAVPMAIAGGSMLVARRRWVPWVVVGSIIAGWELLRLVAGVTGVELDKYRLILYALLLVCTMILRPQGLMGVRELWELRRHRREPTQGRANGGGAS